MAPNVEIGATTEFSLSTARTHTCKARTVGAIVATNVATNEISHNVTPSRTPCHTPTASKSRVLLRSQMVAPRGGVWKPRAWWSAATTVAMVARI